MKVRPIGYFSLVFATIAWFAISLAEQAGIVWTPIWFIQIPVSAILIFLMVWLLAFTMHNIVKKSTRAQLRTLRINSTYYYNGYDHVDEWDSLLGWFVFVVPTIYSLVTAFNFIGSIIQRFN